jgi:hypothetical protein
MNQTGNPPFTVSGRVVVKFCRMVANWEKRHRFTDSFTDTRPTDFRKPLEIHHLKVEPVVGLEPTTDGLQNRCSTTELNWLKYCK